MFPSKSLARGWTNQRHLVVRPLNRKCKITLAWVWANQYLPVEPKVMIPFLKTCNPKNQIICGGYLLLLTELSLWCNLRF